LTPDVSPPRPLAAPFALALALAIAGLSFGGLAVASTGDSAHSKLASSANRVFAHSDESALYAHTATGGTAVNAPRGHGEWVLKLRGVPRKALAFEDRPGRQEDPIQMTRMLGGFFSKPGADPPNAALSLKTHGGRQTLLGVELLDGRYNRDRRVARYRLRSLKQHGHQPAKLPRRFGDTSVFIDTTYNDCDTMVVDGAPALPLLSIDSAEHDSWAIYSWGEGGGYYATPPGNLGGGIEFGTRSGFARGCWNNATYGDASGTVTFSVGDPYTGDNQWSCTATGGYQCWGPVDYCCNADGAASFPHSIVGGGSTVAAIWAVCPTGTACWGAGTALVPAGCGQSTTCQESLQPNPQTRRSALAALDSR
jgi:hypothetical protein